MGIAFSVWSIARHLMKQVNKLSVSLCACDSLQHLWQRVMPKCIISSTEELNLFTIFRSKERKNQNNRHFFFKMIDKSLRTKSNCCVFFSAFFEIREKSMFACFIFEEMRISLFCSQRICESNKKVIFCLASTHLKHDFAFVIGTFPFMTVPLSKINIRCDFNVPERERVCMWKKSHFKNRWHSRVDHLCAKKKKCAHGQAGRTLWLGTKANFKR